MSNKIHLVRSDVLAGFDELVRELGASPAPFYRRVGLSARLVANRDNMIPCVSACALLDLAAKELDRSDFGLLLGSRRKLSTLGLLWPLIAHSATVEQAINGAMKHFHLHNRATSWHLELEGDRAWLIRSDRVASDVPTFQWAVYSSCSMFGAMKALCGKNWSATSVSFFHPKPVDHHVYNRFFDLEVEFNREFTSISFPASDLAGKKYDHNSNLLQQLNKQLEALEDEYERQEDFCSKLEMLIGQHMHSADCTQTAIARLLSMHPKALQRKLSLRGMNFRQLKAEVRLDIAERYLKDSEIPLTTIAYILGFSELSSFSHAFKSRHHVSPAVWRDHAQVGRG